MRSLQASSPGIGFDGTCGHLMVDRVLSRGSEFYPRSWHAAHEIWPDSQSLLDERLIDVTRVHGPRQLTDV